mmetsp:Transcript_23571/g.33844  ORF Transcript_23571/g.33844 Transcript_23571/m.33844 type:complete len:227 (-) Transcript_23571:400-1080(-)|eukprot:CAMPEP_0172435272 /NCGR_PEP_ID=MMETSP1064-20121228/71083_1 /TAXON_ID=202472 /ORGANISM="Aulacoseira subarctica , Strain CCAP 1002/5" /LENGTH=226 /DNA_ID=CAMNT_0013183565 /DNA_START=1529 /DNA_END=2209 /DNA_ORIENTATION=-
MAVGMMDDLGDCPLMPGFGIPNRHMAHDHTHIIVRLFPLLWEATESACCIGARVYWRTEVVSNATWGYIVDQGVSWETGRVEYLFYVVGMSLNWVDTVELLSIKEARCRCIVYHGPAIAGLLRFGSRYMDALNDMIMDNVALSGRFRFWSTYNYARLMSEEGTRFGFYHVGGLESGPIFDEDDEGEDAEGHYMDDRVVVRWAPSVTGSEGSGNGMETEDCSDGEEY